MLRMCSERNEKAVTLVEQGAMTIFVRPELMCMISAVHSFKHSQLTAQERAILKMDTLLTVKCESSL